MTFSSRHVSADDDVSTTVFVHLRLEADEMLAHFDDLTNLEADFASIGSPDSLKLSADNHMI
tara:strand:- start:1843 stop:2028 length:186 start_codon:yes stop_codon:yes gene_type:complete